VDPDFRGFGIGKQLTQLCTDKAKETKETVIALHTSEFMNDARHIYEKMGFKILKEIDQRLGKRYWLYTLEL
ncbi:GNAT family N-acetyltransferase, partial [Shewanella algae]|uniref:GNAT family N-acetyltransferase n=1 Tax=Shewanella algae TaxID=38313 RepID=UPI00313E737E